MRVRSSGRLLLRRARFNPKVANAHASIPAPARCVLCIEKRQCRLKLDERRQKQLTVPPPALRFDGALSARAAIRETTLQHIYVIMSDHSWRDGSLGYANEKQTS